MGASRRPTRVPWGAMRGPWEPHAGPWAVHGRHMGAHDGAIGEPWEAMGLPQIPATPKTLIFLRFYKVFAHAWGIHGETHTGPWGSPRGPKRIYESFMWGHEGSMGGHEGSTGGSCGAMEVSWRILGDHGGTMREHRFIHHRMDPLAFIYLFIFSRWTI